jgi:uncharacterized protein (TIGR02001 family)
MTNQSLAARAAIVLAALAAVPALAQESPAPEESAGGDGGFDISATAAIVSDYRYRGVSLSDRDPAVQGSVDVSYAGFYAGVWLSSVARTADTNVENYLYAGYVGQAGPIEYEVGANVYLYPGGDGTGNIYEGTSAIAYSIGPATARLRAEYAPDQKNLTGDNLYLSAELRVGVPTTPFTLFAHAGRERGSFYGRKWDWSFGVEAIRRPFTVSLGYHDTNLGGVTSGLGRNVRGGIVASASIEF